MQGPKTFAFHFKGSSPLLGCGFALIMAIAGAVLAVLVAGAALLVGAGLGIRHLWKQLFPGAISPPKSMESPRAAPVQAPEVSVIDVEAIEVVERQRSREDAKQ